MQLKKQAYTLHFIAGIALHLSLCLSAAVAGDAPDLGRIIFNNLCFTCHGTKGEGNPQIKSPSIAGEPAWYVLNQLHNFQLDRRGFDPKDVEGQLMCATAKSLNEPNAAAVAQFVEKLPRQRPRPTITADPAPGRQLFAERCMECHRYNAEGELVFGSPSLLGLQDWYLQSQLRKFRNHQRGVAKTDVNGQKMAFSSGYIDDEEMLTSVVVYIMSLQESGDSGSASNESKEPFEVSTGTKKK